MTIWFSSDHHLFHSAVIKYCDRPFSCAQEMYDILLENHNTLVKPTDQVYFLGDFAFNLRDDSLEKAFRAFHGNKHFILGNHDKKKQIEKIAKRGAINWVKEVYGLKVDKHYLWLSHYPHRSWNKSSHGSFHLFGHSHGGFEDYGLSTDVGVDAWNYRPVSFEMILERFKNKQPLKVMHAQN